jgi:CubicO group peptidase (beta-lactamase class C family)
VAAGVNLQVTITPAMKSQDRNRRNLIGRLLFLIILLAPITAVAQGVDPLSRLRTELEPKIIEEIQHSRLPGFAIGVVKDGKLIYAKGFGVAKLGGNQPITSKSLFHMASVTKTFVATAVMQLVEQGKIDLNTPLVTYLPYFRLNDERYRTVTIREMLSHTSGIPDVQDYHWDKPEYDDGALERFVRSLANEKLVFAPDAKFGYSNTAYEILGDVIAKVSGESFEDYVQHHILTPLGMKDSTLLVRSANPQLLTSPHVMKNGALVVSKIFPYNRAHAPSSTLYSSIEDMSRWAIANLNHGELDGQRILKQETAESMWRPVVSVSPKTKEGISWFLAEDEGRHFVLHSGGDVGFESLLVLDPEESMAVVAMTNFGDEEKAPVGDFVNMAIRIMLGRPSVSAPKSTAPGPAGDSISTEETRKRADEVLTAYVSALGGKAALEKMTSRVAKGTFEISGLAVSGPMEVYAKAPNKIVNILRLSDQLSAMEGSDGSIAWESDPDDGVTEKTGLELFTFMRDADFYQPLKLRQQYPSLYFKGQSKITIVKDASGSGEEHEALVLEAPRNGRPRLFYFDARTGLLIHTEERDASGKITDGSEYGDYRDVDGIKIPFAVRRLGNVQINIKLTEVKQNVPVDDSVFVKPKK